MFKCYFTGKQSKLGEKPIQVVIERREKTYSHDVRDENGDVVDVAITKGWEIVKAVMASKEGYAAWAAQNPAEAVKQIP